MQTKECFVMKRKVSINIGPFQKEMGDIEALKFAKSIGADAVDYNLCGLEHDYRQPSSVYSKSMDEIATYYEKVGKAAKETGIEIGQTHGRIEGFKNKPDEDEALVKNSEIDCMATKLLDCPYCVMHGVTTIFMGPDCDPKLMRDLNFDMFCRFLEYAKKYDITLATETFGDAVKFNSCDFFGNIDEFIKTYNRICAVSDNRKYLKYCVDTGHSNKASRFNNNPTPGDVIRMLGGDIVCLHLNDNDKLTDQHKTPKTGTIDWNDVFDALDEVGYNGIYNMELSHNHFGKGFMKESAEFSVKVMKYMLEERYGK